MLRENVKKQVCLGGNTLLEPMKIFNLDSSNNMKRITLCCKLTMETLFDERGVLSALRRTAQKPLPRKFKNFTP